MLQTFLQDLRTKAAWCETTSTARVLLRDGTTAMALYRAMRFCQRLRLVPLAFLLHRMNACMGHATFLARLMIRHGAADWMDCLIDLGGGDATREFGTMRA